MLNKKDNLIIFVLCLIVISLGVLLMVGNLADVRIVKNTNVSINKNVNINQNQNINTNNNQQTKTIIDGVDVSDWNIYENEEYGYSIKYPTDWDVREFPDTKTGASFTKDNNNKIVIDRGASSGAHFNDPFDEYIYIAGSGIQNYESLNSVKKIITYFGIKGYRIKWNVSHGSSPDTISSEMIYFEAKKQGHFKDTKTIVVSQFTPYHSQTDEYYKIFNIMIKTFDYIQ